MEREENGEREREKEGERENEKMKGDVNGRDGWEWK